VYGLLYEEAAEVDVRAGGGGVKRRPQLAVKRVHVGAVLDQQARHLLRVVDTALRQNSTPRPRITTRHRQVAIRYDTIRQGRSYVEAIAYSLYDR